MKNRLKIILIAIVIIFVIGAVGYTQFHNHETILVGKAQFVLPQGYTHGTTNEFGNINITNGSNTIFITEYPDGDLNKHMMDYINYKKNNNFSVDIKNLTIDNLNITKVVVLNNNKTVVNYFFVKNNVAYDISSWDSNNKMDSTVVELINSIK